MPIIRVLLGKDPPPRRLGIGAAAGAAERLSGQTSSPAHLFCERRLDLAGVCVGRTFALSSCGYIKVGVVRDVRGMSSVYHSRPCAAL
jgi:hypothetical protein